LEGKTFVVSGVFTISRDQIKELVVSHGGKCTGSVSGKTSYLLAGDNPGGEKIKKAEKLGITIITEDNFREMIKDE
jgi:DNA ligase (NAD+)